MFDAEIVVAGHICLDVIPTFAARVGQAVRPGTLVRVGPARFATGGAVANVGLALQRLGCRPRLVAKIGDDAFGATLLDLLRDNAAELVNSLVVTPGETTSYSVVINPPGIDRTFLHCPGANDHFAAADLAQLDWSGVRLFHFGYPPLMARIAADDGAELAELLKTARRHGVTTSLDLAWPDPAAPAGQLDWAALLRNCLPLVDCFLPSAEELVVMLDQPHGDQPWTIAQIDALADRCLAMGAALVAVKLGEQGMLLRTTTDLARLEGAGVALASQARRWVGRHLLAPCFAVEVTGTTGAGDATIAGLLLALLTAQSPADAMTSAVAVGACSVQAADAASGVPTWAAVQDRVARGWPRLPLPVVPSGWQWQAVPGIWRGPFDQLGDE